MNKNPKLYCPEPGQEIPWRDIVNSFPWFSALETSEQDSFHHREGNVMTHVMMVGEALVSDPEWQQATPEERLTLWVAMLLHDVAKPQTQTVVDGHIVNPGHSRLGALESRRILWQMDFSPNLREIVCNLIAVHQAPFWILNRETHDAKKIIIRTSLLANNKLLGILAKADATGRICTDQRTILDSVELYREYAQDLGCLDTPYGFENDETRVRYFTNPEKNDPAITLWDETNSDFEMVMLSGLPCSGKSTWVERETKTGSCLDYPVVSLDNLRAQHGVGYNDNQGKIIQASKEEARIQLRQRQSFIWDATNLSPLHRGPIIQLARDYGARIRLIHLETTYRETMSRNKERGDKMIPQNQWGKMISRWEPPMLTECHLLERVVLNWPKEQKNIVPTLQF
jgi:predicted kinase